MRRHLTQVQTPRMLAVEVSCGMAHGKRDSGSSSGKSASGGTPPPVSHTVARCNIADLYARAWEVELRILQVSSSPTESHPTDHGQQSSKTSRASRVYFLQHLQEELSGAIQSLSMVAKSKEVVLCTYIHVYEVLQESVSLVS
jgi:hypothetical protein